MEVYHSIDTALPPQTRTAVACGYFDGLHIGHASVIGRAVARTGDGLLPAVFTFAMRGGHPDRKQLGCEIITDSKKYQILEGWGVAMVLSPDFGEFKQMSPEQFVDEILVRRLNAAAVICGYDFHFGCRAAGDVSLLAGLCNQRGIELDIVPAVLVDGERVSSTRIRALLGQGDVETAGKLLGRAFGYDFTVVHGKRLGRTIDSPTINQRLPDSFVSLRHGVYAAVAFAEGRLWPAVTNIGNRPTVEEGVAVNSETYIYGFSGDLYGRQVEVRLLRFLRDEQRFPSVEKLRAQIQSDILHALPIAEAYITEKPGK